ncbi:MAG: hypothetical protein FJ396_08825 [Verrucomicrobia bacterium]|nr:hypothetical protein [Verrucomicrobiota bacterium]
MKLQDLHLGQRVLHPQHGEGVVKAINEFAAEILFLEGRKPVEPESGGLAPAEPQAGLSGLSMPLETLLTRVVDATVDRLGVERPDGSVHELASRWKAGRMVLQPADPSLQAKEVDLETFFHKLVMMRNQLRVLEQKINASETLSSAEKFDWQQYITRCYGSMTTFNLLFKDKESNF